LQDMQELALEAVEQRQAGNGQHFTVIALELETTLGKSEAARLITRAQKEYRDAWRRNGVHAVTAAR
jgi:acid stress-induced BolA-like protein IbaG/YrbA